MFNIRIADESWCYVSVTHQYYFPSRDIFIVLPRNCTYNLTARNAALALRPIVEWRLCYPALVTSYNDPSRTSSAFGARKQRCRFWSMQCKPRSWHQACCELYAVFPGFCCPVVRSLAVTYSKCNLQSKTRVNNGKMTSAYFSRS